MTNVPEPKAAPPQKAGPPANPAQAAKAASASQAAELARVKVQVESARRLLARLLQDVVVAESRLGQSQAAQLLQANEQLVVSAMRSQADADTAALALARISWSAERDPLTQLPNRVLLLDRFEQAIAAARRKHTRMAVLFLDLNHFKRINDTLGHATGDDVLKLAARRLVASVRDADTVSRHGGDEFVILLTEIGQAADAAHIAGKMVAALGAPSRMGAQVLRMSASIGISLYPDDGQDSASLLALADAAMYRAKRHGVGSFAFHGQPAETLVQSVPAPASAMRDPLCRHDEAVQDHQRLQAQLREANEQLVLAVMDAQTLQAAAERAHQHQAAFVALVAEELGNPLAPINLAAAMLGQEKFTQPLLPRLRQVVEQHLCQMQQLVDALKPVPEASEMNFQLSIKEIDLHDVIDAAVAACRPAMDARLQNFTAQLPEQAVRLRGDAARLQQMLGNLLDNASRYTPDEGNIHLALKVADGMVELSVADSGVGITPAALPTLFEPFEQDAQAQALGLRPAGLGIGLTVVRALAQAHGGAVSGASAGNARGSRFTVRLPLLIEPVLPR